MKEQEFVSQFYQQYYSNCIGIKRDNETWTITGCLKDLMPWSNVLKRFPEVKLK